MKKKKEPLFHFKYFDTTLTIIILAIVIYGLLMIYSASYYIAGDTATKLVKSQIIYTILGFVGMIMMSVINYKYYKKLAWIGYYISIILLILLKTPLGKTVKGATRWLRIGPITFQVAEVIKIAMIVFLAYLISEKMGNTKTVKNTLFLMFWPTLIALMVYKISNNMSTAIIIIGICAVMMFVTHKRWYALLILAISCCLLAGCYIYKIYEEEIINIEENVEENEDEGFRAGRIRAWINPEKYASEQAYQALQSQYAIGFGGLIGKGLGNSIQKKSRIPEPYNDMIFAIICEELGLIGAGMVVLLFSLLFIKIYSILKKTKDPFGHLIVLGVLSHFALQVILNIAVATGSMPTTGVTLPFFSYGGTASLFLLIEIGLILSIDKENKTQKEKLIKERIPIN